MHKFISIALKYILYDIKILVQWNEINRILSTKRVLMLDLFDVYQISIVFLVYATQNKDMWFFMYKVLDYANEVLLSNN